MYSTYNTGKSVVAGRLIRSLKKKFYKCMTSISKNRYIDKLPDLFNEHNDTYHSTIRVKPLN